MSTFKQHAAPGEARIPPGHVTVPRFSFVPSFLRSLPAHLRFDEAGPCVGLRPISDADALTARVQAAKQALEMHPRAAESRLERAEWEKSYRQIAIRHVVGFGTCDANDASKPCPYWASDPVEELRHVLTEQGMGAVFDAWEKMRIGLDSSLAPIDDDKLRVLSEILATENPFAGLSPERALRARRLLAFCFEELSGDELA